MTRPTTDKVAEALLASFSQDEVPAEARKRAFAAFGIATGGGAAGVMKATDAANAGNSVAPGATMAAKSGISFGTLSLVKVLLVGAGAVVVMHAAEWMTSDARNVQGSGLAAAVHGTASHRANDELFDGSERLTTSMPVAAVPSALDEAPRALAPARRRIPTTAATNDGAKPMRPTAVSSATPAAPGAPISAATLSAEVVRLDRSRAALRAGAYAAALAELDAYDAEFAGGTLGQEATVLRIDLLAQMGDMARARTLADAFAAAHPKSGYLAKIRERLARPPKQPVP